MHTLYRNKSLSCILCLLILAGTVCSERCHSFDENSKHHLSSRTPYSYVANYDDDPVLVDGCTPVRVWAVIRHGTRTPGSEVDNIKSYLTDLKTIIVLNHEKGKGNLCAEEVEKLREWQIDTDSSKFKRLTHEGEEEMLLLAERFQNRFPDLLPESYSNKTFKFRHTATQRTRESAQYFTLGMFGRQGKSHVWYPEPLAKDPILRFYKLCKRWRTEVDKNPDALAEMERFKTKPIVKCMLYNISKRIGLTNRLKYDDAILIYQMCGFETAWHPKNPSPWCALFTKDDLEILEYAEDLKYYYVDGYGFPITYKQACVAIVDMFHHLTDSSYPPLTFYFTHSGTILKLLSHLGLYRDPQPLTADLFNKTRLWRTSNIDAFGSNLAFVLYRCEGSYKVMTLHQERPVTLPGCPQGDLCPLSLLQELYADSLQDCNFEQLCNVQTE